MGLRHSRDSATDSFERVLATLDTRIRRGYVQLSDLRLRESRARMWIMWYVTSAYAAVSLALLSWPRNSVDQQARLAYNALKWGTIGGGPLLIYYALVLVSWYHRRKLASTEEKLENLKAKQHDKVEELKEMTRFYKAKELIDRYENVLYKEPDLQSSMSNLGSRTSLVNDSAQALNQQSSLPSSDSQEHLGDPSLIAESQGAQSTTPSIGQQITSLSWYDKVMDKIVGEDEIASSREKYALICRRCLSHNGLALPENFNDMRYFCPHCKFFNEAPSILHRTGTPYTANDSDMLLLPPSHTFSSATRNEGGLVHLRPSRSSRSPSSTRSYTFRTRSNSPLSNKSPTRHSRSRSRSTSTQCYKLSTNAATLTNTPADKEIETDDAWVDSMNKDHPHFQSRSRSRSYSSNGSVITSGSPTSAINPSLNTSKAKELR